ncbi:MAG: NAD-dependent epimerase/dehydratase family protein [Phycisphaerales bacterium]
MKALSIIITGCNGRLGRSVGELACARGWTAVGLDAAPAFGRPHAVVVDDLRHPPAIHRAFERLGKVPDAVVHLANHTNSLAAPAEVVLRENVAMNTAVFMAAAQAGVKRIVFSSSVQAFIANFENDGSMGVRVPQRLPFDETLEPMPSNAYGVSKLVTERMLDALCNHGAFRLPGRAAGGELSAVSLRLPYILNQQMFEGAAKNTGNVEYRWGGPEAFAYIHVDDAAEAVLAACASDLVERHEVVWVSALDPRVPMTVAELVERHYAGVAGAESARAARRLVDCAKAARMLGWTPKRHVSAERQRLGLSPVGELID